MQVSCEYEDVARYANRLIHIGQMCALLCCSVLLQHGADPNRKVHSIAESLCFDACCALFSESWLVMVCVGCLVV